MNLSTNIYGGVIMDLITHMKYERTGKVRGIYWLFQIICLCHIGGAGICSHSIGKLFDQ